MDKSIAGEACFILKLGKHELKYSFNFPSTYKYFGDYLIPAGISLPDIKVSLLFMEENLWLTNASRPDPWLEFQAVMLATAEYMLQYCSALFHGVSFIWGGKAWIITAPSGTGKTTQLVNWMRLYQNQTQVINGDKTGLECRRDGSVYAFSTPWRGKENYGHRDRYAELGGIILLEQGEFNSIIRLSPEEAVYPLFIEFISIPETERQIMGQREVLSQMIDSVPVWKLVNLGDKASTILLHQTLQEYLLEKDKSTDTSE